MRKSKKFLASDPDREGEAIAWHLSKILELEDSKENRVVFNEITKMLLKIVLSILVVKWI